MPTLKPTTPLYPGITTLVCGEHGDHSGDVVGCCHVCGLFLCKGHANHLPRRAWLRWRGLHRFGTLESVEAFPLVCGKHAPPFAARAGLPDALPARSAAKSTSRKVRLWTRLAALWRSNRRTRRPPPPPTSRRG